MKSISENYFDHHEHIVKWSTTIAALRAKVNSFTAICLQNKAQAKSQKDKIRRLESIIRQQQDQINGLLENMKSKFLESPLSTKRSKSDSDAEPKRKKSKIM